MKPNIVQLHKEEHANLKISSELNFELLEKQNMVPIIANEYSIAATELPVVFIKDEKNNRFMSVVVFGLKPEQNLYYKKGENNKGKFVPAMLTHEPFRIAQDPENENRFSVFIDLNSRLVSEKEGGALFTADGKDTELLTQRVNAMSNYSQLSEKTREFVEHLVKLELLASRNLSYKGKDKTQTAEGIYAIDENKLNSLSDKDFDELRKRGFLAPIYSHLVSLNQMSKLVKWTIEEEK